MKTAVPLKPSNVLASTAEDQPLVPAVAPKPSILPTGLSRAIVLMSIIGAVALIIATWMAAGLLQNRYSMVAGQNPDSSVIFRLDERTGVVSVCSTASCRVLRSDGP